LHKLVHEHTKDGGLPGTKWDLPERSVVIIDETAIGLNSSTSKRPATKTISELRSPTDSVL